jgi:O-antigen/teichoic acid export membrane protein
MNRIQKIAKNVATLSAAQIITALLKVILFAVVARHLGPVIFGKYTFCLSFVIIFLFISDLGVTGVVVRDVSADPSRARKYLANMLVLQSFSSLLTAILAIITIYLLSYPKDVRIAVWFFTGGMAFFSLSGAFRAIFQSFQVMKFEAALRVLEDLFILLLSLVILGLGYGLIGLSIMYFISQVLVFLASLIITQRRFVKVELKIEFNFWKKILATSVFFALAGFFWVIYYRIDTVMLSIMKGDAVVGWYNASYSLMNSVSKFPALLGFVLFPAISEMFHSSRTKFEDTFNRMFIHLLIIGLFISTLLFLFSGKIISLIFGKEYNNSILSMQILSWAILFFFPAYLLSNTLKVIKRHKALALILGGGALFNILLNLVLIPKFSLTGAALATVLTEGLVTISFFICSAQSLKIQFSKKFLKTFLAFALMLLGITIMYPYGSYAAAILGITLYFLVLYFTKCIGREDLKLFQQILPRRIT